MATGRNVTAPSVRVGNEGLSIFFQIPAGGDMIIVFYAARCAGLIVLEKTSTTGWRLVATTYRPLRGLFSISKTKKRPISIVSLPLWLLRQQKTNGVFIGL